MQVESDLFLEFVVLIFYESEHDIHNTGNSQYLETRSGLASSRSNRMECWLGTTASETVHKQL